MTNNVDRPAHKPISVEQWRALTNQTDSAGVAPRPRRTTSKATAKTGGARRGVQRTTTNPAKSAARKRTTKIVRGASPGLAPAEDPSRGPWVVEVDWLGRPLTVNAERTGAMSIGTMLRVRDDKREWQAGFVEVIRHVGIPPLARVFVVVQAFYNTNNVPDPDGLSGVTKAVLDSLVEAGVLPNDKRANLPLGFLTLPPVTDGGAPRVAFTVHPMPEY